MLLIAVALFGPSLVSACTCICKTYGDGSPLAMKHHSAGVFVGEVLNIEGQEEGYFGIVVKFRVERYWKGVKTQEINVRMSYTCCSTLHPEVGRKYLVYAVGKRLETVCTRTRLLEAADDDLRGLGSAETF
jgi:hypothetical protein